MTDELVHSAVERLAELIGPQQDEILAAMDEHAEEISFPTVGRAVGGWLALLARTANAKRVFEFGSGFGYSAYWFARAVGPDGEVILTEVDADELELAREYFERAGIADRARFEHGDAIETVKTYDGPFDVVLIDNEKHRYREAFDAVAPKLRQGSLVIADNAVTTGGSVNRDEVVALLAGEDTDAADGSLGVAEYLDTVRQHDRLETVLLPLGEGLAVSRVTRQQ